jgi:hypothetical protein
MSDEVQAVAEASTYPNTTDTQANPGDTNKYVIVRKDVSPGQKYEDANFLIPTTEAEKASRIVDHPTLAQYVQDIEAEGHKAVEGLSHEGNPVYMFTHEAGVVYVSWKRHIEDAIDAVEEAVGMKPTFAHEPVLSPSPEGALVEGAGVVSTENFLGTATLRAPVGAESDPSAATGTGVPPAPTQAPEEAPASPQEPEKAPEGTQPPSAPSEAS